MAGGVSGYLTAVGSIGREKMKGKTPIEVGGTSSTLSHPSIRQAQDQVEWCCSCTRQLTCFTSCPSDQVYKCFNAGWN